MRHVPALASVGTRYGRVVVLCVCGKTTNGSALVMVVCDCGSKRPMSLQTLREGRAVSCGCYRKEFQTLPTKPHREKTRECWRNMIQRTTNPKHPSFDDYGGRGIGVCDRWQWSFRAFFSDMGEAPQGMSLDRIDNEGNYEPTNCRWATASQQQNNKRNSRFRMNKSSWLQGRDSVYEDAIAHGAGEWVTNQDGAVVWKWKTNEELP